MTIPRLIMVQYKLYVIGADHTAMAHHWSTCCTMYLGTVRRLYCTVVVLVVVELIYTDPSQSDMQYTITIYLDIYK